MPLNEALRYTKGTLDGHETFTRHNLMAHDGRAKLEPITESAIPNAVQPRKIKGRPSGLPR